MTDTPSHADRVVASLASQVADQAVRIAVLEAQLSDARQHLEHHHLELDGADKSTHPDAPLTGELLG